MKSCAIKKNPFCVFPYSLKTDKKIVEMISQKRLGQTSVSSNIGKKKTVSRYFKFHFLLFLYMSLVVNIFKRSWRNKMKTIHLSVIKLPARHKTVMQRISDVNTDLQVAQSLITMRIGFVDWSIEIVRLFILMCVKHVFMFFSHL